MQKNKHNSPEKRRNLAPGSCVFLAFSFFVIHSHIGKMHQCMIVLRFVRADGIANGIADGNRFAIRTGKGMFIIFLFQMMNDGVHFFTGGKSVQ